MIHLINFGDKSHHRSDNWPQIFKSIRRSIYQKIEKTNLTVKQMVAGSNEVKGPLIFNNWGILK